MAFSAVFDSCFPTSSRTFKSGFFFCVYFKQVCGRLLRLFTLYLAHASVAQSRDPFFFLYLLADRALPFLAMWVGTIAYSSRFNPLSTPLTDCLLVGPLTLCKYCLSLVHIITPRLA